MQRNLFSSSSTDDLCITHILPAMSLAGLGNLWEKRDTRLFYYIHIHSVPIYPSVSIVLLIAWDRSIALPTRHICFTEFSEVRGVPLVCSSASLSISTRGSAIYFVVRVLAVQERFSSEFFGHTRLRIRSFLCTIQYVTYVLLNRQHSSAKLFPSVSVCAVFLSLFIVSSWGAIVECTVWVRENPSNKW